MVSSIFNICSCFLYFTELTWLQNKIENNPLHCCLDWYWCILLGYTRCCDVLFMVSNARDTGTWTNVKFIPTRDLIRVKCPGLAHGGWAFLDLTHTSVATLWNDIVGLVHSFEQDVWLLTKTFVVNIAAPVSQFKPTFVSPSPLK